MQLSKDFSIPIEFLNKGFSKVTVIPHWLTKQAQLAPKRTAIERANGETINFATLETLSKTYAKKLATLGIKKGTHVGLFSGNERQMIITIHALSYLGAVIVMLNRRLTASELSYQLQDAHVELVLVSDQLYTHLTDMNLSVATYTFSDVEQLLQKDITLKQEIPLDEPFTIMYTSGTTGKPKGVVHTYGNHWFSAIGSALNLGLQSTDKWLCALPIFHVSGFSICMRSVIYGMPLYLLENFSEEAVHEAIIKKGVTIVSVVTVMLERLLATMNNRQYPNTFRCMLLGGGACPVHTLENAKQKNIHVFQSYGMTETSSQIVTLSPEDAMQKLGASGKPLIPAQLKITNPDDEGIGEIYVKGPMVTKGYYNNEQANRESFHSDWLATGDLGYVDNEGFLYVVERRTDLIISGGENIYPTEIEHTLAKLPGVKDVGVVGVNDVTWGAVPIAFIVKDDESLTEDKIIKYAKQHLADYKLPQKYMFVEQLPRNASNKLMRHQLKMMLGSDNNARKK